MEYIDDFSDESSDEETMTLLNGLKGIDDLINRVPPRTKEGFYYEEYHQKLFSSNSTSPSSKRNAADPCTESDVNGIKKIKQSRIRSRKVGRRTRSSYSTRLSTGRSATQPYPTNNVREYHGTNQNICDICADDVCKFKCKYLG